MADEGITARDRTIRTEALHASSRLIAGAFAGGHDFEGDLADLTHAYAHYIHSGQWFVQGEKTVCPYGDSCRFNRASDAR